MKRSRVLTWAQRELTAPRSRTIAVTPSKAKGMASEDVTRVCQTYAVDGLRVLSESSPARPLRYVYLSGMLAERDQTKRPVFAAEYCLMRASFIPHQPNVAISPL